MFIETTFDSSLVFLVFALAIFGLIRGFLSELASIVNWFGAFYLTSKLKPFVTPFFRDKIHIPFLLDVVVNAILFSSLIIGISIINKYLVSKLKQIVPNYTNSGLGFLFGFAKGLLLSCLILAFFSVIYKNSTNQPNWLANSYIYNSTKNKNDLFISIINSILGDLIDENFEKTHRKHIEATKENIEKLKKIQDVNNNLGDLDELKNSLMDNFNSNENIKNNTEEENIDKQNNLDDIEKLIDIIGD